VKCASSLPSEAQALRTFYRAGKDSLPSEAQALRTLSDYRQAICIPSHKEKWKRLLGFEEATEDCPIVMQAMNHGRMRKQATNEIVRAAIMLQHGSTNRRGLYKTLFILLFRALYYLGVTHYSYGEGSLSKPRSSIDRSSSFPLAPSASPLCLSKLRHIYLWHS